MSDSKAYIYNIAPNSSSSGSLTPEHQISPAWVLTFLRWQVRDTLRTIPTDTLNYSTISQPLIVQSDCVQVTVGDSKSSLTPSMSASLKITDVNYETEISPGDFVFVNMLNWEQDASRIVTQASKLKPINGINDGFKGFFKVQSVRKELAVEPQTGTKNYFVKITGFAFTEFNNAIYFNPYLINQADQNPLLFASLIGFDWSQLITQKGLTQVQSVMKFLIQSFVGTGFTDVGKKPEAGLTTSNTHFYLPPGVGYLLGIPSIKSAKDAYNFLFGIQSYSSAVSQSVAQGLNPTGISADATKTDRFMIIPGKPVEGDTVTKPEYWNQVKAWSILNQFTNAPLNELYTCFRTAPNGSVMPTMVFRQIPFTTDSFAANGHNVTRFMNIPRWNIDPALALAFDLGKDEVARINFVQIYGRSVNGPSDFGIPTETAAGNYLYDLDDVKRNGLRPYVITSEFDRVTKDKQQYRSIGWAKIVGDALIGGHLKLSGTISFVGIVDPIAVGDNLQFDNVVYHIEQISHNCAVDQNGNKVFRTTIVLSNGMHVTNSKNVHYPEMTFGSAYDSREHDFKNTNILPGVSESQNIPAREGNLDIPHSKGISFVQPNTGTSITKRTRDS